MNEQAIQRLLTAEEHIVGLERQLAEAREPSDLLLRGLKRQYDGELTPIEAVGFALGRIGALERQLEAVQRAAENYAGQDGREALFDAGMIAAGEGILAILGEKGAPQPCEHDWIDARNKVVKSGEYCGKCGFIRSNGEQGSP